MRSARQQSPGIHPHSVTMPVRKKPMGSGVERIQQRCNRAAAVTRVAQGLVLAAALTTSRAQADAGPPMITDDPGTPGDGHWEINIATLSERGGDTATYLLPLLDINYGLGERVQLKFEMPWELQRIDGAPDRSGAGNSLAGVKWRYFDGGEDGWQMSTYPQLQSRFPVSGSPVADSGVSYLLPLEFQRKLGEFGVNFEIGRWFRPRELGDTWVGGVVVGREIVKGFELLGELHEEKDVHSGRNELTANFGARWELSERFKLLASAGTDLHNGLDQKAVLLTYLALQINL
jgi:hypothetical protein